MRAETEAGTVEGIRHTTPGESVLDKLRLPQLLGPGKAQNAGPTESTLVEYPKTGTTCNTGPAPYGAAGSLSSVDRESTPTHERE